MMNLPFLPVTKPGPEGISPTVSVFSGCPPQFDRLTTKQIAAEIIMICFIILELNACTAHHSHDVFNVIITSDIKLIVTDTYV